MFSSRYVKNNILCNKYYCNRSQEHATYCNTITNYNTYYSLSDTHLYRCIFNSSTNALLILVIKKTNTNTREINYYKPMHQYP